MSPDGLVTRDIATWALPTDAYAEVSGPLQLYAEEIALSDCMAARGLTFEVVAYDWNLPHEPTSNPVGRYLFDSELAAVYGYHTAPDPGGYGARLRERDARDATRDETWWRAHDECGQQVVDNPPVPRAEASKVDTFALSGAHEPEVLKAAEQWKTCMAPLGIADLPDSPEEMPSPSLANEFGLAAVDPINGTDLTSEVTLSTREVEVAVADAKCRDSSGYRQAYYDAEWSKDYQFVQDNLTELTAQREQYRATEERLKEYILGHR